MGGLFRIARLHYNVCRRTRHRRTQQRIPRNCLPAPRALRNRRPARRRTPCRLPALRRRIAHRHLRLELRRIRGSDVRISRQRALRRRSSSGRRHRLAFLRHRLRRTLHADTTAERGRIPRVRADKPCRQTELPAADDVRHKRRQRTPCEHIAVRIRPAVQRHTLRHVCIPQHEPLHQRMHGSFRRICENARLFQQKHALKRSYPEYVRTTK